MMPVTLLRRAAAQARRLTGDRRGLAMVEFAFAIPIMLILYLGGTELVEAISVKRLTVLAASTVANLVTQYSTISASQQMPDILTAATKVMTPYPAANQVVTVSCINIDSNGKATIAWSQSSGTGSARTVGSAVTVPAALDIANTSLVLGETTYSFVAAVDYMKYGTFILYSSVFMSPRLSSTIALTS